MSYGAVDYLVILCLPQTCQCVRIMFACVCGCLGWGGCCVSVQDQAHHVTLSDLKFSANFSGAKKCMPFPHRHNSHFLLHPAPRCEMCETRVVKRVVKEWLHTTMRRIKDVLLTQ